jgi:hypothetical protein
MRLSSLGTSTTNWPIILHKPRTIDDEWGAVGGMRIRRGNRSTRRKPAPVPLCPPQIPRELTLARIRASAVGSRRLTAWAMVWPFVNCKSENRKWYVLNRKWRAYIKWECLTTGCWGEYMCWIWYNECNEKTLNTCLRNIIRVIGWSWKR